MPWVRAELRGQRVYARADERGELAVDGGRVEVRYRRDDGKLYRAAVRNLTIVDPTPLPDGTCSAAAPVSSARAGRKPERPRPRKPSPAAPAPDAPPVGTWVAYTDGACSDNPGPAGLGVVIVGAEERIEISEYLGRGTNNIAELTAVLRALEQLPADQPARIYTDSKYTIGVVQQGWKAKRNAELVATLRAELARRPSVELVHVPGHAGVFFNERADQLARRAIAEERSARRVVRETTDGTPRSDR